MFELIKSNCSFAWLTVHGQHGTVVQADSGFLFLPAQSDFNGGYWSSTEDDSDDAWAFIFPVTGGRFMLDDSRDSEYAVRPFQK